MSNHQVRETIDIGSNDHQGFWMGSETHRNWLHADANRQLEFFRNSRRAEGGFYQLDGDGVPNPTLPQELYSTSRMVHSYALGLHFGFDNCEPMIDHGMKFITEQLHDPKHGGYFSSLRDGQICDDRKLAYGHAFVMLAASSALRVGHPDAASLLNDITHVVIERFWEEENGVFADETKRDWTPFSTYRGFNANMHSTESLLAAFEATGDQQYLDMAGSILEFFAHNIAPDHNFRFPEHYKVDWSVDRALSGDPMFRPAGTTPGHSFEMARLLLQHWDLAGRKDDRALVTARRLVDRALLDSWNQESGGIVYTLDFDGNPDVTSRYWWPVTEAIGVLAALIKLEHRQSDEEWYRQIWRFTDAHFVDHTNGGWFPEIDANGRQAETQFKGKPDIYHSIQATLFPLSPRISNIVAT